MAIIHLPYIPTDKIALAAEEFLEEHGHHNIVPVDIEILIEKNLDIHIVPKLDLQRRYDIEGFTLSDWSEIWIDQRIYLDVETRCRFTLAHEVGHYILHKEILDDAITKANVHDIDSWVDFIIGMEPCIYSRFEQQSYIFAGMLLVPRRKLLESFNQHLSSITDMIREAQSVGVSRSDYISSAIDRICTLIAPEFNVSIGVISRRIQTDELDRHIP